MKRLFCVGLICLSGLFVTIHDVGAMLYANIVFLGSCEFVKNELFKACFLEDKDDTFFELNGLMELEKSIMYRGKNITLIFRQSIEEWKYNPVLWGQNIVLIALDSEKIVNQNFDTDIVSQEVEHWLEIACELDSSCKVILVGSNCNSINRYQKNLVLKTLNCIASRLSCPKRIVLAAIGSTNTKDSCERLLSEIGNKIRLCLSNIDFLVSHQEGIHSEIYTDNFVYQQLYTLC